MNKKGRFNNELAFGVELELLIPREVGKSKVVEVLNESGIDTRPERYGHDTVEYWKMTTDSTVDALTLHYTHTGGHELVSPKLYGQEGKAQLKTVLKVLNDLGCRVNKTCGTHVHHDVTDVMIQSKEVATNFLNNLISTIVKYEHLIYRLVSPSRLKKVGGHYWTKPARVIFNNVVGTYRTTSGELSKVISNNVKRDCDRKYERHGSGVDCNTYLSNTQNSRYCGLNLKNIWTRGSVEFRYHQGTLSFEKLWSWIVFTQAFIVVNKKNNRVNFSPVQSNRDGLFHLRRAVGFIGSKDRCEDVKFANKVITKRFAELTSPQMYMGRRSTKYYNVIKEQLQRGA